MPDSQAITKTSPTGTSAALQQPLDSARKPAPDWLQSAKMVLQIEQEGIAQISLHLDQQFNQAVQTILACTGRVVVSGMGKSGHVARKIAATLASTGTPAFFVHPGEASHGDLGMVQANDVFLAFTNSGSTEEIMAIAPQVKRVGAKLIAVTGKPNSPLARIADVHLNSGVEREACSLNLAPTASTTAAMALGDALAVVLLEARGFSEDDFAKSHPGGALGKRLLTRVSDIMRQGDAIPVVLESAMLSEALLEISKKRMGMTAVTSATGELKGIFTDGDLRRLFETGADIRTLTVASVMTKSPVVVSPNVLAAEAVRMMEDGRRNQLLVVDPSPGNTKVARQLVGALHLHDLLIAKVV
jgi:arabinose-5-phosphate isomerase